MHQSLYYWLFYDMRPLLYDSNPAGTVDGVVDLWVRAWIVAQKLKGS